MLSNSVAEGFDQGVKTALAMDPAVSDAIGLLALLVIAAVGLLLARGVYRWFTR